MSARPRPRSISAPRFAAAGRRVLVIDLDPQGNASTGLGIARSAERMTSFELILGETALERAVIVDRDAAASSLVPASLDLAGAELELAAPRPPRVSAEPGGRAADVRDYDDVLIDCPPSLNLLTVNALVAADSVLVPLQCEFYALEGLSQLIRTIERVQRALNPRLELQRRVLTMFDRRNNLCDQVAADVRGHFGAKRFRHCDPAQCAHLRGAFPWQAGADLRPPLRRLACLYPARR